VVGDTSNIAASRHTVISKRVLQLAMDNTPRSRDNGHALIKALQSESVNRRTRR
jgi:hypothetical protein